MAKRSLSVLAVLLLLGGCSERKPPPTHGKTVDKDGWPSELYYHRLTMPVEQMRSLATRGTARGFNLLGAGVVRKHYDQTGPTAHGAVNGTDVFWVPEQNVFFLRSDCDGHHVDGYIGPFEGDPRVVLEPESLRQARSK